MVSRPPLAPAFGQADLSNCEREQINFTASIQPHGALLVVREPELVVIQASAEAAAFMGLRGDVIGRRLDELDSDLSDRIRPLLNNPLRTQPVAVRGHAGPDGAAFDFLLHRPPEGGLVIELEPAGPPVDVTEIVQSALRTVLASSSLRTLCDETARIFQLVCGYDRVMVYRFDEDGHGEVFSEQRRPDLEAFLGNRYPASDIPQIARRLYERNRVRLLVDVEYDAVPLIPRLSPVTGCDLDMSLCGLRSMSPIHIQYLKNMGVAATLVASLVVDGRLWGLIACHHYAPRFVHFEIRAVCELLAESVATRIAALESFAQGQAELSVRRLEQRMIEATSREGDWRIALFDGTAALLTPVGASGAALLFEGQILTTGEVPSTPRLREIGAWLDTRPRAAVIATSSLASEAPEFSALIPVASGVLATPVSNVAGEYLVWFRPEQIRTVTWGGDPYKPMVIGADPADLSPRRSFAQWHQLVEGTAEAWSAAELTAARMIGESVTDVVLQFRSVRMLIAQDQLAAVEGQVRLSDQPVIIADAEGRVLLTNESFTRLLPAGHAAPRRLEDLPALFTNPADVRGRLREVTGQRRTWRGEVGISGGRGAPRPLLVRADPVFSSPGRVLGFVLLFTDLSERKAAEAARRRFQEGIVEGHQAFMSGRLDSTEDLVMKTLLSSVVENAQLAALEITDSSDMARMPEMLESVRASVSRTSEVLAQLIARANRRS